MEHITKNKIDDKKECLRLYKSEVKTYKQTKVKNYILTRSLFRKISAILRYKYRKSKED